MTNPEIDYLRARAAELTELAEGRPEAERAAALAERLDAGRFSISVVGEFKRGKSTLVNALVGEQVAPTGVLPLTAVRTELTFGPPASIVEHLDGSQVRIDRSAVAEFVAEEHNPGNEKKVARVLLSGEWELLVGGAVLIDTPGVGSVYEHNSVEARAALLDSDGAIVVLAADAPLSAAERDMLGVLRDRQAPVFFALNKVDHLSFEELAQVRRFIEQAVEEYLGRPERIFAVDARSALKASGSPGGPEHYDFADLRRELRRFVADDLVGALERSARRELSGLGRSLGEALDVEDAMLETDSAAAAALAAAFDQAGDNQRRAFTDDVTLLHRDVVALAAGVRSRLEDFARREPSRHFAALEATADSTPAGQVADALWAQVREVVRSSFEAFRATEADRADREWRSIAEAFRHGTETRVAAVRDAAADLFRIDMGRLSIPPLSGEQERFFYLFLHVGTSTELIGSLATRLLPARLVRGRALRRARHELEREFAKHAGRAGWDFAQRLSEAARKLEQAMAAELEGCIDGISRAARRAEQLRREADQQRTRAKAKAAAARRLARDLASLDGTPRDQPPREF
jgi:GTP-binding protein EngB required for normal cell division